MKRFFNESEKIFLKKNVAYHLLLKGKAVKREVKIYLCLLKKSTNSKSEPQFALYPP